MENEMRLCHRVYLDITEGDPEFEKKGALAQFPTRIFNFWSFDSWIEVRFFFENVLEIFF